MRGLILRGVDFGPVLVASGTLNFFGEGWPYHRYYNLLPGFDFSGATFVAKTTTLGQRAGNMPLDHHLQPKEFRPSCIKVNFRKRAVLNAVGLSGPGARALFETGRWQARTRPFFISFMAVRPERSDRLKETAAFVSMFKEFLPGFKTKVGLQINISCPNTDHDPAELAHEAVEYLEIASQLGVPLDLKINALTPIEAVLLIERKKLMDSLTVSNTIPWGKQVDFVDDDPRFRINWQRIFGSEISPLHELGGGGLSGEPLLPIVAEWVHEARAMGISIPIVAGGGVLKPEDARHLFCSGASAIAIGSVAILRPWRVKSIIDYANK